jgi:hypothetical protein
MWKIIFYLSLFLALMQPLNKALRCFSTLTSTEDMCETTLSCFAYVARENEQERQYGCVDTKVNHLFMCNAGPTPTFTAQCCNEDMCNQKLNLTLPELPEGEETPSKFVFVSAFSSWQVKLSGIRQSKSNKVRCIRVHCHAGKGFTIRLYNILLWSSL